MQDTAGEKTIASYNNKLYITSGDTTDMLIDSSGNVGIGSSSPDEVLEVSGDVKSSGSGFGIYHFGDTSDQTKIIGRDSSHVSLPNTMEFYTNSSTRMSIDSSGNVGIGVVPKTWTMDALQLGLNAALSEDSNSVYLSANAYNNAGWKRTNAQSAGYVRMGTNDGLFSFSNAATGAADSAIAWNERFRIDSSGNVGIGTSSPSSALDVIGEAEFGDGTRGVKLSYSAGNNSGVIDTANTGDTLEFRIANSEKMRIDSSGNVLGG